MSEPVKETVIIVHGTWAGAAAGKARWYQAANGAPVDFIAKLNAALERRGSAARCWAHCAQESQIFHWSGENSWTARTQAASALADYVVKLRNDGWRCHIVAHSHGGNVMVEALPQLMAAPDSNNLHGRLVTLGTPFIDTMSPILRRSERGAKVLRVVSWIIFAILILMLLSLLSYFGLANVGVYFFGILIFLFLIGIFFRIKRRTDHRDYWPIIDAPDHTQPQLLAIGSPMDEPWQVLHHMRIADNPLAVRSNFLSYILSSLRSIVIQRGTVARIHGARSYRDLGWLAKLIMAFLYLSLGFLLFGLLILPDQESASRAGRTAARADEAWLGIVATTTFLFCVLVVFTQLFGREFFPLFLRLFAGALGL